ncbi:RnfH family protein [Stenoxybacter acetivorans]|uniref:RnfH family protein n=1 Tax=Stenoxybacter acetivorans TaxID=422441 RepID=UPI000689B7A6|nr:RnfH family protein [Stenoxybacter acetivorans]
MLEVEVAYASPQKQVLCCLKVAAGTCARQAVLQSRLPENFPDVDFQVAAIGIFGKKIADDVVLHEFDRVEVYRPLLIDPKEGRRNRAKNHKVKTVKSSAGDMLNDG